MGLDRIININGHPTFPYVLVPIGTVFELNRNTDIPPFYEHNGIWRPVNIKAIEEDSAVNTEDYKAKAEAGDRTNSGLDGRVAKALKGLAQKAVPALLAGAITLASLPLFGGFFNQKGYADGPAPMPAPTPVPVAAQSYEPDDEYYLIYQKEFLSRRGWQEGMENLSRLQISSTPIKIATLGYPILCPYNGELEGEMEVVGNYIARDDLFVPGCVTPGGETHETQAASIFGSKTNNSKGIAGIPGPKISVKTYGIDITDTFGFQTRENVIKGIDWIINNNIQIANFSNGTPVYDSNLKSAIDRATDAGIIIAAANGFGNNDISINEIYPAAFAITNTLVLSVGGVDEKGNKTTGTYGSNYLPYKSVFGEEGPITLRPFSTSLQIAFMGGTSSTAPQIAGLAAIPLKFYLDSGFLQKEAAIKSVYAITRTASLANNPNQEMGYGKYDVSELINFLIGPLPTPTPIITPTITPTPTITMTNRIYLPFLTGNYSAGW